MFHRFSEGIVRLIQMGILEVCEVLQDSLEILIEDSMEVFHDESLQTFLEVS